MKHQFLTSVFALGLTAIACTASAFAQDGQTATIPFSFIAGGVEHPEGEYRMARLGQSKIVRIVNVSTGHAAMVSAPISSGKDERGPAKLVFERSADGLLLSEVKFAGRSGMLTGAKGKEVSAKVSIDMK